MEALILSDDENTPLSTLKEILATTDEAEKTEQQITEQPLTIEQPIEMIIETIDNVSTKENHANGTL